MQMQMQLPAGMHPGRVIGTGGCIAKQLTALTGVALKVIWDSDRFTLKGRNQRDLARACELLEELFNDYRASSAFGERCQVLSGSAFAAECDVEFAPRSDEVSWYLGVRGDHFVLVPADGADAGPVDAVHHLAEALATARLGMEPKAEGRQTMYVAAATLAVVARLAAAAAAAAVHSPAFDELKLRFNFGKMFFYKIKGHVGAFSQQTLQAMRHRTDFDDSFSNCVPAAAAARLQEVLTGRGFQQVDHKHSLTVHVGNWDSITSTRYGLSFDRGDDETPSEELVIRKIKTSSLKVFALTTLGHGARDLDYRLKLIAQNHFDQETPLGLRLQAMARQCRVERFKSGWRLVPMEAELRSLGLCLRACRFKSKSVFQGSVGGDGHEANITLRVSILTVQGASYEGDMRDLTATEVTGSCVQLSAALEALRCSGEAQRAGHQARVATLTGQLRAAVQKLTLEVAADDGALGAATASGGGAAV